MLTMSKSTRCKIKPHALRIIKRTLFSYNLLKDNKYIHSAIVISAKNQLKYAWVLIGSLNNNKTFNTLQFYHFFVDKNQQMALITNLKY